MSSMDGINNEMNIEDAVDIQVEDTTSDVENIDENESIVVPNKSNTKNVESISTLSVSSVNKGNTISSVSTSTVSTSQILATAEWLKKYVDTKHGVPDCVNIKVDDKYLKTEEFLYLMSAYIKDLGAGKNPSNYAYKNIKDHDKNLDGLWLLNLKVTKKQYVDAATRVYNFILEKNDVPNTVWLINNDQNRANYNLYTYNFASILTYYKNNNALPSDSIFDSNIFETYSIAKILSDKSSEKLTFYLTTDEIINSSTDNAALNTIKNTLTALGYNVKIVGVGPDMHNDAYKSGCIGSNSVLLCCFGGVDVCPIEEWVGKTPGLGSWFPNAYAGANILSVFYLDPYGCAANINDYVGKAWDAKKGTYYGEPLDNPAQYMKDNGISYIQTGTVDAVIKILKSVFGGVNPDYNPNLNPNPAQAPTPAAKYVTISQVVSAAASLKSSIYYYGVLPSTVTVGSYKVSTAQFDYLMSVAIKYLKAGKKTSTNIKIVDASSSNPYYYIKYTVKQSNYVSIANKIIDYYNSHNKKLPSYVSVSGKKLSYRSYTYAFANILAYYKSYKKLPSTCLLNSGIYDARYVTVASILKASNTVSKYISSHKKLPSYVTMGSYRVKMPQFTYLMSKAIQLLNSKKKTTTKVKIISSVSAPSTVDSVKYTASKSKYVSIAKTVSSYVSSKKAVPASVTVSSKKLSYKEYMYGFARVLSYYYSHKKLPSSVSLYGF